MAREQSSSVSSAAPAAASRNGMAARLNGRAETVPSAPLAATAAMSRKAWPLSFSQQRLWLLEQLEPGTALYNIPTAVRITGHLDVKALARAFNSLITRHEALRARFDSSEEEPRQIVEPEAGIDLPV
ncbi:MAG TPA: condensation domain-containing protein, partial [Verrucomicrobiae bacterium]|nr:condensation domain-containing protein [Verrucomicrobiae bacterium]